MNKWLQSPSPEQLKLLIFGVEACWLVVCVIFYLYDTAAFWRYAPFFLIGNLLTLLPFQLVFRSVKPTDDTTEYLNNIDMEKEDKPELGLWEKSVIVYFPLANAGLMYWFYCLIMAFS